MTHFYLTLTSNASLKTYPRNTVANYTNKLPSSVQLDGDWEVGLIEIMYPHRFMNVRDQWFRVHYRGESGRIISLKSGYYPTPESVIDELKEAVSQEAYDMGIVIDFCTAMPYPGRIITAKDDGPILIVSPLLRSLHWKDKLTTLENKILSLFVYCDVLEHVPVGDTLAPLLRCVVVHGTHDSEHVIERFVNPMYLPVQKKEFESLEINIRTDTGDPMPFVDGRSSVTLHFRRTSNPYFLSK